MSALDREAILAAMNGARWPSRIVVVDRVGSTNDEVRRLTASGAADGTAVIAGEQSAGRGRRGRRWESPPRAGLYVSVALEPAGPPTLAARWTLAAAVAAAEACRILGARGVTIHWPNDLYHGRRKLGGILAEMRGSAGRDEMVIGTGINVGQSEAEFSPALADVATSLRIVCGAGDRAVAGSDGLREALAGSYLAEFGRVVATVRRGQWNEIERRWLAACPGARGRRVVVLDGDGTPRARGRTDGIAGDGSLLVRGDDGQTVVVRLAESVVDEED